ncbi:MAG TPA: hypothetical protein VK689_17990 [Armatimonadota bacterium]|nr:hypothetical protein [Armatimonadota bacterium]
MASNSELEVRWVDAWVDLDQIVGERWNIQCLLPDGRVVSMEECQGWLQDSAYDDWQVKVEAGWVWGKQGVIATRWRDEPVSSQPSAARKRKR